MTTVSNLYPNQVVSTFGPTVFKTERNQYPYRCSECGKYTYVDEGAFNFINYAINAGFDNPFRCEWCSDESYNSARRGL